ncbi:hypothetical protein K7432_005536 [Basidiobolus ranarum]
MLYDLLRQRNKTELSYCSRVSSAMCDKYDAWSMLPWNKIYNLNAFQDFLRLHERWSMEPEALKRFNQGTLEGIHYIKDIWKDEIQYIDEPRIQDTRGRYLTRINISELRLQSARIICLGSVFGTHRVTARTDQALQYKNFIRSKLIYSHPSVLSVSKEIIQKLGGLHNYFSIHTRIEDSIFIVNAEENVKGSVNNMLKMLTLGDKNYFRAHGDLLRASHSKGNTAFHRPSLDKCLQLHQDHPTHYPIIYLSTDTPDPLRNTNLTILFHTFPCTFFAGDFRAELTELQKEYNPLDGTNIGKFLVPMVESMVAANGEYFVGTNKSTFSENIRYLHNTFLGRLDPIPLKY